MKDIVSAVGTTSNAIGIQAETEMKDNWANIIVNYKCNGCFTLKEGSSN